MLLTHVELIIIVLAILAFWAATTSSSLLRTMRQAGNPASPQAALGQAALNSAIGCLGGALVVMSLFGAFFFYTRRPALPVPWVYMRLLRPEQTQASIPAPLLSPGQQVMVVVDTGIPMYRADEAGRPTDEFETYLWPGQVLMVVAGPGDQRGREVWYTRTRDGIEGWVPGLTPSGGLALAPR